MTITDRGSLDFVISRLDTSDKLRLAASLLADVAQAESDQHTGLLLREMIVRLRIFYELRMNHEQTAGSHTR